MGEGITDAKITRWLVQEGDEVEKDQPLVEIATDKVDSEIFASEQGVVSKILKQENEIAEIGEPIVLISTHKEGKELDDNEINIVNYEKEKITVNKKDIEPEITTIRKHYFIPPYIRTLAIEYNVSNEELYSIKGSGTNNTITVEDIKNYILNRNNNVKPNDLSFSVIKTNNKKEKTILVNHNLIENSEIIEMDRMRKLIAEHMVRSKSISPHVTSFIEADVSNLVSWRNKIKDKFLNEVGEKLTYTPIFVEAVVNALKKYPMLNASVDENKIYIKKNINIGIATALTNGNLIVPVIKEADKKNLMGLAKEVNDIVSRARQNQLTPSEVKGGTFTITNLGNFESLAGTPIINQPEVGILAIGSIIRKPAVVKVKNIETIGIRDIVMLSLAYDHRIIDGSLGGMFLKHIKDMLQNFDINRSLG